MTGVSILFIDPTGWQKHSVNAGLGYLSGMLLANGISCKTLDLNNNFYSDESIVSIVDHFKPKVIGVSLKTATAREGVRVARLIRDHFKEIIIVGGGPHVTIFAESFLRENRQFDYGCVGDGEGPLLELWNALERGERDVNIQGICHVRDGAYIVTPHVFTGDIGSYPFPDFRTIIDFDPTEFRYPLVTSRGCPFKCVFCSVGTVAGKKFRRNSPDRVLAELTHAAERYRLSKFEILDDVFTLDMPRAKSICRGIIGSGLDLEWWCHNGIRADQIDDELAGLMRKAGCISIAFGVESTVAEIFDSIRKGETVEDVRNGILTAQRAGIRTVGYFIIGLPGSSIANTIKTVFDQRSLNLDHHTYNMLVPYVGTELYDIVQRNGRILFDPEDTQHFSFDRKLEASFEYDGVSAQTIVDCHDLATNQAWVAGYRSLIGVMADFSRHRGRPARRAAVVTHGDGRALARHIALLAGMTTDHYQSLSVNFGTEPAILLWEPRCEGRLRESGFIMVCSPTVGTGAITRAVDPARKICKLRLPPITDWVCPDGTYFAASLPEGSFFPARAANGTVYLNGRPLPFHPAPRRDGHPHAKVEGPTVFISASRYSADDVLEVDFTPLSAEVLVAIRFVSDDVCTRPSPVQACVAWSPVELGEGVVSGPGVPTEGMVVKDGVLLPWHPDPRDFLYPCGKVSSGRIVVSNEAFDPSAIYAVLGIVPDRLPVRRFGPPDDGDEWDILFVPAGRNGKAVADALQAGYVVAHAPKGNDPLEVAYRPARDWAIIFALLQPRVLTRLRRLVQRTKLLPILARKLRAALRVAPLYRTRKAFLEEILGDGPG